MEGLVLNLKETQWDTKDEIQDMQNWFFMRSPIPVVTIMISYWLFVLKVGPKYMKDREPMRVKKCLVAYNIFQVMLSLYVAATAINFMRTHGFFPSMCPGERASKILITRGFYVFLIAKVTELLDTVFFVLKKNAHQITFLHVYHHSITVVVTWIAIKLESANPSIAFLGAINSCVHVVMYTYYGLSAFPSMTKHLWWKKYITSLQLVQFFAIIAHHFVSYKIARCVELDIIFMTVVFHLFLFVYLFLDFYIKTYVKNKNVKTEYLERNGQNKTKQN